MSTISLIRRVIATAVNLFKASSQHRCDRNGEGHRFDRGRGAEQSEGEGGNILTYSVMGFSAWRDR